MIVLLWLCLIIIPPVIGLGILVIAYGKRSTYRMTLSEGAILGLIASIGISEGVHILGMFKKVSLQTCGQIWGIILAVMCVVSLIMVFFLCKKQKERFCLLKVPTLSYSAIPFLFIGLLLVQALFIFCMRPVAISGDITVETTGSFLSEDGIYRVLPLTGRVNENLIPMRYSVLCLPTVYAMLSQLFGQDAEFVVCHVVPVVILLVTYLSFYYLSGVLFGTEAAKKRYMFLVVVALFVWFSDGSSASAGFGLLHGGYLGTTIRNMVLVPYVFAATLQKQWWKAVLCIFAEACIVWTLWGLGVCAVVFAGVGLLTILDSKNGKVHRVLQIFRDKEDLA